MKDNKDKSGKFDPSGNYTGKYINNDGKVVITPPEQDADDL